MEAKHTPGPWRLQYVATQDGLGGSKSYNLYGEHDHYITHLPAWTKEDEANTRLIAAAPDLLAALEEAEFALHAAAEQYATDKSHRSTILDGRLEIVRKAIAKARGGE